MECFLNIHSLLVDWNRCQSVIDLKHPRLLVWSAKNTYAVTIPSFGTLSPIPPLAPFQADTSFCSFENEISFWLNDRVFAVRTRWTNVTFLALY